MSKQGPILPTVTTIKDFLREAARSVPSPYENEMLKRLNDEIEQLESNLLKNSKLRALGRKRDKLSKKLDAQRNDRFKKIRNIRMILQTHGATPKVIKLAQELAKEMTKD